MHVIVLRSWGGEAEWPLATLKALAAACLVVAVPFMEQIAENQGDLWTSQLLLHLPCCQTSPCDL